MTRSGKFQVSSSKFQVGGKRADLARVRRIVPPLLRWFAANARDLPWRRTRDPYAIWISEVMLQQTQVKTVVPYFERWMRELPDVASLAAAREQRVLKLWEGLGYYRRARNLQRAAREIVERHDGRFPRDFDAILALPGIGRYTAGAISSIAFNQPAPILDGNVTRVLARLTAIRKPARLAPVQRQLWALAKLLVSTAGTRDLGVRLRSLGGAASHVGECSALNQSLMELGALVCTPRSPRCTECPVRGHCEANRLGMAEALPVTAVRPRAVARRFIAIVAERAGHVLVRQRPDGVVNAGLWEFPSAESEAGWRKASDAIRKLLPDAELRPSAPWRTVRHSITRYRITVDAYRITTKAARELDGARWVKRDRIARLPFTAAHAKIRESLLSNTE